VDFRSRTLLAAVAMAVVALVACPITGWWLGPVGPYIGPALAGIAGGAVAGDALAALVAAIPCTLGFYVLGTILVMGSTNMGPTFPGVLEVGFDPPDEWFMEASVAPLLLMAGVAILTGIGRQLLDR